MAGPRGDDEEEGQATMNPVPTLAALVACLALAGCSGQPSGRPAADDKAPVSGDTSPAVKPNPGENPPVNEPTVLLRAISLIDDYGGNEAAADAKYLNKTVEIRSAGIGFKIEKDDRGRYTCVFNRWTDVANVKNVVCVFSSSEVAKLATVGHAITIRGVCKGKIGSFLIRDDLPRDPSISLEDCVVVEDRPGE
jgi:hypothetical protein